MNVLGCRIPTNRPFRSVYWVDDMVGSRYGDGSRGNPFANERDAPYISWEGKGTRFIFMEDGIPRYTHVYRGHTTGEIKFTYTQPVDFEPNEAPDFKIVTSRTNNVPFR